HHEDDDQHEHHQQHQEAAAPGERAGDDEVPARGALRDRFGGRGRERPLRQRRRCGHGVHPPGDNAAPIPSGYRGPSHPVGASGNASSTASPYSASFFAPTPLTAPSCATLAGRASTIPTSVASENTMYGGICFSFATAVRQARRASKRSRWAGSRLSAAREAPAARRPPEREERCGARSTASSTVLSPRSTGPACGPGISTP